MDKRKLISFKTSFVTFRLSLHENSIVMTKLHILSGVLRHSTGVKRVCDHTYPTVHGIYVFSHLVDSTCKEFLNPLMSVLNGSSFPDSVKLFFNLLFVDGDIPSVKYLPICRYFTLVWLYDLWYNQYLYTVEDHLSWKVLRRLEITVTSTPSGYFWSKYVDVWKDTKDIPTDSIRNRTGRPRFYEVLTIGS